MGFDLHGMEPSSKKDEYFRNNMAWWYPLWKFICDNCSEILHEEDIRGGQANDHHLFDQAKALRIA